MFKRKTKKILAFVLTVTLVLTMSGVGNIRDFGTNIVKAADEPSYNAATDILLYSNDSLVMEQGSQSFGVTVSSDEEYYISFTAQTAGEIYFDYRGSNSRVYLGQKQCAALGIASGNVWPQGDVGLSGDGAKVTIKSSGTNATIWVNGTEIVTDAALATTNESGTPKISWASTTATFTDVKVWQTSDEPVYNADTDTLAYSNDSVVIGAKSNYSFGTTSFTADQEYYVSFKAKSTANVYFNYRGSTGRILLGTTQCGLIGLASEKWPQGDKGLATDGIKVTVKSTGDKASVWINGEKIVEDAALATTGETGAPAISWTDAETTVSDIKVWKTGKEPVIVSDEPVYNEETDTIKYESASLQVPEQSESFFDVTIPNTKAYYMTMDIQTNNYANVMFRQGAYLNIQPAGYQPVGTSTDGWVNKSTNLKTGAKLTVYSAPDTVSVWLNGEKILDNVAMTTTDSVAKPGISWSFNDIVTVTDAMVWVEGKDPIATVDGTEAEVIDGKVTLGDATYGYYCDGKMYKAGSVVEVTEDMAFTSVNSLSVDVAEGAGIRVDGTAGIRFRATVTTDNETALASDAITEAMLITANDLYQNFGELTTDCDYTKLTVNNTGWYNDTVGTYCGSVVNIVESNYIRKFIARAYVTVNYTDGTSVTVYSGYTGIRSIKQVAAAVIEAGYQGLDDTQKALVDTYAAAVE